MLWNQDARRGNNCTQATYKPGKERGSVQYQMTWLIPSPGRLQLSSATVSDGNTQSPLTAAQHNPERSKVKYKASFKIVCCQVKAGCVDIIVHDGR